MADIFISYSSKDREQAEQLVEILSSAGLSCWIDRHGIDAATSWSSEISKAITDCKALVVMLSPSSVVSKNVAREVALAFERDKKILPLDLEPVALTDDLAYQLAGIQRCPMTNIDAIISVLGKLGLEASSAPQAPKIVKDNSDTRKSLIILPFEDLSPTQDNGWFANGLTGELIDVLGKIKSLRILDRKTSLDLRGVKMTTVQLGKEFNTRYFVEGSVRKFGDQIKISASLLDIETSDQLWQESYKGVMQDIFDLQENVAMQIVEGLKLHLTKEEKYLLAKRGTENAEAYELWLKGAEYFNQLTKNRIELSLQLFSEAIHADPNYMQAYVFKAIALIELYRSYDPTPALLDEAEQLCEKVKRQQPENLFLYSPLIRIATCRGKYEDAERMAQEWISKEPENQYSHFALGFFYHTTNQPQKAIAPYESALKIMPNNLTALINIVPQCSVAGDARKCAEWAGIALPYVEKHLRLHPENENYQVWRVVLIHFTGEDERALETARKLVDDHSPKLIRDNVSLYNLACLFAECGGKHDAIRTLRRAVEAGFRHTQPLKEFLSNENIGIIQLAGTPEYEEVKRMVEEIEANSNQ